MTFDDWQPGPINRLMTALLPAPQSRLTNPRAPLPLPQPDAQPESYMRNVPGALAVPQPAPVQSQQAAPSGLDKFTQGWKDFDNSTTGKWLNNMFSGWAQGNSPSDSIAKGGLAVQNGKRENQTIKLLMNNGYSQEDAEAINGNRDSLNMALANIMRKQDPAYALQTDQAKANLAKTQAETNQLNAKAPMEYGFTTLSDGTVVKTNKATGDVTPAYNPWSQDGGASGRGAPGTPLTSEERKQFGISDTDKTPYIHNEKGLPAPLSPSLVNLSNAGETAEEKALGEARAKNIIGYMDAGQDARKRMQSLNLLEDAFNAGHGNIVSGPGAETIMHGKQLLQSMGVDVDSVAPTELVSKLGTVLASQAANGLTSRPTQFDFQTFLKNNPGLGMTEKSNRAMINIYKQQAQRDIDLSRMAQSYKGHTADWNDVVSQYDKDHPIMSPLTGKPLGVNDKWDDGHTSGGAVDFKDYFK